MDFTLYWFMFPTAIIISTLSIMSGIAGTALFMPIFLLIFPILGIEYEINSPAQMVAAALLTSTFGFTSGFIGYYRRKLIDFELARRFFKYAVPAVIIGILVSPYIGLDLMRCTYGLMTLVLAYFLLSSDGITKVFKPNQKGDLRMIFDNRGNTFEYPDYKPKASLTSFGAILTGFLAVGIGETTVTQLSKLGRIPIPVAAATSIFVVIITIAIAALSQVLQLTFSLGFEGVPWHLVTYTIPGVIIGGQIGPLLQGSISSEKMQRAIAQLFIGIGIVMIFMGLW